MTEYILLTHNPKIKPLFFSGPTKSWHSKSGMPQWLRYELKQPRQVCKISFLPRLDNSFGNRQKDCPKHFEFQGSDNGRNFITLLTVKNQQCPASKTITHTFKNNRAFKFYRVFIRNTPGRSARVKYVVMGNLQLFGNGKGRYHYKFYRHLLTHSLYSHLLTYSLCSLPRETVNS